MNNLKRLGDKISIPIPLDENGYIGRECPQSDCEGYFKIISGTGLKGDPLFHCPYCGYKANQKQFWTKEQIEYAKSFAINQITGALLKDLKSMEFEHRSQGSFGIGISLKVTGKPHAIRYYREKKLETEIVCDRCTLRYAIYGVFAFCPDCGTHNSLQILEKNLELAEKEIVLSTTVQAELSACLIADALENMVSAFDGFGREILRVYASLATAPDKAENLSFQNLIRAQKRIQEIFDFDFAFGLTDSEWELACRCFQKRHLLAHKMGVVDEAYLKLTNDPYAVIGRKIHIDSGEVVTLASSLKKLGAYLTQQLEIKKKGTPSIMKSDHI
ncbi:MAG: hypothetical protein MPEBLZ_02167 [Candidatus Methanoperedens nitroreducens]|uniref:Uncharacterized protein n=1 Tax=Candidatus Methanoperedens nitratireducens TaxID=1392998 RepID=A0A0P8DZG2_9EURY|nr:hypothetical protein [Candidatus Methanoperedens sp. BLZ2]KAB2941877.1 MAG: hypothetical protein F9K14_18000 [Candidatus Methanoperedens sp.]KPQ43263.1 MAG: hypothetical protein MPEBLZ_02167 [Candidatus Methanoperedens sp. BLZ1]MBZ0175956.1 hypothetical protein [Candidatus Methanoperedens nitroreducens]MCX9078993.1 hypothetical protein [Candidatus Methanoperedens sp.]